jgi:polyisoprenoid-binding protein YceI
LLSGPEAAQAQRVVATVDSTESVIDYTGSAPLHDWTGTSRSVSGTLVLDPETPDSSRAVLRVPVASFDSGNNRRDRKMREVTEAERYPTVEFRATDFQPELWGRASEGHAGRWRVTGDLTFHGRTHPVEVTADVAINEDRVRIRAQFPISLTRFEVERPSILWASIGDKIRIDARIVARVQKPSSAAR